MDEGGASMVKKTAVRTAMTQSETVGGKRRSRYSIPESVVLEAKAAAVANNAAWWGVKGAVKFQVPKELRADGAELKRQLNAVTRDGVMPEGFRVRHFFKNMFSFHLYFLVSRKRVILPCARVRRTPSAAFRGRTVL